VSFNANVDLFLDVNARKLNNCNLNRGKIRNHIKLNCLVLGNYELIHKNRGSNPKFLKCSKFSNEYVLFVFFFKKFYLAI